MQIQDNYKTIAAPSKGFFKDRGSKFYAFAFPISSEEDVIKYRASLRKKYYDARHHVYAFCIILKQQIFCRSSDNGEPLNSSGPYVLGQIKSYGVTNVLIIVIRYFGGTKLGIQGLIKAYKTARQDALNNAKII